MKKILITLALAVATTASAFAQLSIGAGFSSATELTKIDTKDIGNLPLSGFYAGLDYTIRFGAFGLTPGVYASYNTGKGGVISDILNPSESIDLKNIKTKEIYLNVPLHLSANLDLKIMRLYIFGGPTLNFGLLSEISDTISKVNLFDKDHDYGRIDVLLGAGVGMDLFRKIRVTAGYNWGMLNRSKDNNVSSHRNELRAGVAFVF